MLRLSRLAVLGVAVSLGAGGCSGEEQKVISLESPPPAVEAPASRGKPLRFAVGGMITPKEGMGYYRDFLRYLEEKIGTKIRYVDREDYAEINEMLRDGQLDAAFVCSGPYVDAKRQFGLELLAAPQAYGETTYRSYIIVARRSARASFAQLRGARFAFTDPLSNTGKLVPTYLLSLRGETPESFFAEVVFSGSHDKSIKAVAAGVVDAAAVDSLIWEYLDAVSPEVTAQTRIIERSPPYATPPIVVPRGLAPELKDRLRRAVLGADADPKGREILRKMRVDRFVVIPDSAYDSVREMQAWVARQQAGR